MQIALISYFFLEFDLRIGPSTTTTDRLPWILQAILSNPKAGIGTRLKFEFAISSQFTLQEFAHPPNMIRNSRRQSRHDTRDHRNSALPHLGQDVRT